MDCARGLTGGPLLDIFINSVGTLMHGNKLSPLGRTYRLNSHNKEFL